MKRYTNPLSKRLTSLQKKLLLCGLVFSFLSGCTPSADSGKAFLSELSDFCGYRYQGETTVFSLGTGDGTHPLEDPVMWMTLSECSDEEIRIPFQVDEDRSRTWVLQMRNGRLHLSHDHRYPDGTEYDQNRYGGYSDDRGTSYKHFFPADAFTISERPQREINVWSKEIDKENKLYYYRLYLEGELRFEATFDLAEPHPLPEIKKE